MRNLLILAGFLFWGNAILAIPLIDLEYHDAQTGITPWVTLVSPSGIRTITPVLTTISGTPATLNAFPTPTTPTSIGPIPASTAIASSTTSSVTGIGAFEICNNANGQYAPLCPMPNNNTLYISETYYITWDTSYYNIPNTTVRVMANYNNATGGGPQAYESEQTLNSWGYVSFKIEKSWLQGASSNNLTLYITSLENTAHGSHETESRKGPTITITSRPYQPYTPPPPTKAPTGASLYIALPTVAAFIILVVCGGCIINSKHRRIGLGNVMSRNRGYKPASKKARRQRLDLVTKGDSQVHDHELQTGSGIYRDVPVHWREDDPFTDKPGTGPGITISKPRMNHIRHASEDLDSLVDTPKIERGREMSWDFGFSLTPTRTKSVGDRGFVKEEVQIIERHSSGGAKLPGKN